MKLTLSPPIAVGRRSGYYWFPTLMRLSDGALLVSAYDDLDAYTGTPMGLYNWSEDGGQTWTDPPQNRAPFSECAVLLSSGDLLLLPYRLFPDVDNTMWASTALVPKGRREIRTDARAVRVSSLPHDPKPQGDASNGDTVTAGFSFNGQAIYLPDLENGRYLTTLYGRFVGDERYCILFAESSDGFDWVVCSVLYGNECSLPGTEGPCEAALAQLGDRRFMCVFRLDGNIANVYDPASETSASPYGVIYSEDEGLTWTTPAPLNRPVQYETNEPSLRLPGSVQPSLALLNNGTLVLSGGRPGLFLWLSQDGSGQEWVEVDMLQHHNQHCAPDETIDSLINTSSYTEVVALPDDTPGTSTLLVVYDRLPRGWFPIPQDSPEQCSIWTVKVTVSTI